MYGIQFYTNHRGGKPIMAYLETLREQAKTQKSARIRYEKLFEYVAILKRLGTRCGFPFVRHLEDDIWELRPTVDRILFAYWKNNQFVFLHSFVKKTQKAPPRELQKVKAHLADFLQREE